MMRALGVIAAAVLAAPAAAADLLHVPVLVKYHQESHVAAGAIVAVVADAVLREVPQLRPVPRALLSVGVAAGVGWYKEHHVDRKAHDKEITPWAWGAGAALILEYSVRW